MSLRRLAVSASGFGSASRARGAAARWLPQRRALSYGANPDLGLTEEEKEFRAVALDFAAKELKEQAPGWDQAHFFPKETLRKAAALGFGGIYVQEEHGGTGLGRREAAVVFEALATGCVSTAAYLTIHNMCSWMVDRFGSNEQRKRWVPELVTMDRFASYCLTEPGAGSDAASLATRAQRLPNGEGFVLNGSKAFISGASASDVYLIMARTGGDGPRGISCFLVPADSPGLSFGAQERKLGWHSQPTAAVILEDCRVGPDSMLGPEGEGFKIAMKGLDGGRINIATTSLGGAQACLDHAVEYVKVRNQFGRPLAALQSVQFKLADMATELQAARLMVRQAADLLQSSHPDATMHCAMAKRFATDAAFRVCNEALQLHGGYGYLQDYPVERFFRDVRVHQILEGTNEIMKVIVARELLRK